MTRLYPEQRIGSVVIAVWTSSIRKPWYEASSKEGADGDDLQELPELRHADEPGRSGRRDERRRNQELDVLQPLLRQRTVHPSRHCRRANAGIGQRKDARDGSAGPPRLVLRAQGPEARP